MSVRESAPPAGWVSLGGVLVEGPKVADYAARGQNVRGVCSGRANGDCKRTLTINSKRLCEEGFGRLAMKRVSSMFRCQRLDDCMARFWDLEPDLPLSLSVLKGRRYVRVRLKCRGCGLSRGFTPEEMIARLEAAGKGNSGTLVKGLGGKISGSCPNKACGKSNWEADVLWANVETMGWKTMGERVFDENG